MVTKTLEWTKRPLGELAHIKTGSRNNEEKNPLGRYPFFVRSAIVERIKTYSYDEEAILVPGEGNIGNIFHYIKGRFDAHQRVYVIDQFQEEIKPSYLYWYMKRFFGPHALKNTAKATVDSLRLPTFQSFKVRYPQPPEQRSIAEVLSGFDEHLANLDELIAKKKNIRNGMLEELATGKRRLKGFIGEWTSEMLRNIAVINPKTQLPDSFEYVDLESVKGSELIGTRRFNSEDAPSRAQRVASA